MKRHANLVALAREHHQSLVMARWAKAATVDEDVALAAPERLRLAEFRGALARHASREEAIVGAIPESAGLGLEAARLRAEHLELLDLMDRCGTQADLNRLGNRLEAHTRWEDREFFAQLEAYWARSGQ